MKSGGMVGFERVEWFNGGLFDDDASLPLEPVDIDDLLIAAHLDWSEIDPSVLGTLFERGLDPDKRSQLGAHYTDREKILQIIDPVVAEPLQREWADARARITELIENAPVPTKEKLLRGKELAARTKALNEAESIHRAFLKRLEKFRVLDPACGSGNFLYLSLLALKDIEHRANVEAEVLGLPRGFPRVGPENVMGLELNPYAAELARISVWIGEIQWMRRNGFEASRNPILRTLTNIECRDAECRDALLTAEGKRADWPDTDAIVGNPPFLGSKFHRKGRPATKTKPALKGLGDNYTDTLYAAYRGSVPASADLVSYWFANAAAMASSERLSALGLIATKSIGKGASNKPLSKLVTDTDFRIFSASRNQPWVVDGAQVRVAVVCAKRSPTDFELDGKPSGLINPDLTAGLDVSKAKPVRENRNCAFQGVKLNGPFEISDSLARSFLQEPTNPNGKPNSEVVRRFAGNDDVTMRDRDAWVLDFTDYPESTDAALFEKPFQHVRTQVAEHRRTREVGTATEVDRLEKFWLMQRPRPKLRSAVAAFDRIIAVPETSEHLLFRFLPSSYIFSGSLFVICRDDHITFGILSSHIHRVWTKAHGNQMGVGNQGRYNATRTFLTFPFPVGFSPDMPAEAHAEGTPGHAIATAAAALNTQRENWLNPPNLAHRVPDIVECYPERVVPLSPSAAEELAKRTLTKLYNDYPEWLKNAQKAVDEAVSDAYGWGDDFRKGTLSDEEILARLFNLNQERTA